MHRSIVFAALVSLSPGVHATLIDRGGGLIYDDTLDITWLQDANYAQTSGYHPSGSMDWDSAVAWTEGLSYYDPIRDVTWSDWRLPTVTPVGTTWDFEFSNNGTTDWAYTLGTSNEMAYMYYVNLGNLGYCTPNDADPASCVEQAGWGLENTSFESGGTGGPSVSFLNLYSFGYWTNMEHPADPSSALSFYFGHGFTPIPYKDWPNKAWAVRSGDVGVGGGDRVRVPEPTALALLGAGLIGLGIARRAAQP